MARVGEVLRLMESESVCQEIFGKNAGCDLLPAYHCSQLLVAYCKFCFGSLPQLAMNGLIGPVPKLESSSREWTMRSGLEAR